MEGTGTKRAVEQEAQRVLAKSASKQDTTSADTKLTEDDLQPFFQDDFDVASFSTSIIRGHLIKEQLEKLNAGIDRVQKELYAQVASRHADLITQATGIQRLEDVLAMITARVEGLQKSVRRIKDKLRAPYEHIAHKTRRLERMQVACELLRRTVRFLTLVSKLRQQRSGGDKDMSRAAYTLSEIQHLVSDKELHGIHVIERDRAWVYEAREDIEKQARDKLSKGLDHLKHQTLTTALQVFHNLGSLKDEVDAVLQSRMLVLRRSLDALFALPQELRGKHSTDSAIRAHVWEHLDRFLKHFRKLAFESRTLQLVMVKRRSQSSYETFAQIVEPAPGGVAHRVWSEMLSAAHTAFEKTPTANAARKVLEAGYPKMLQLFLDKWRQILDHFSTDYNADLLRTEQSQLRETLRPFERSYVSASLSRMFDPVNRMFPEKGAVPPSPDDVSDMVKSITSEVTAAIADPSLLKSIARNALKTAEWYCIKSEHLQATDHSAINVAQKASVFMKRNIGLVNRLGQLATELAQAVRDIETAQRSELAPHIRAVLAQAEGACMRLAHDISAPLLDAARRYILETIAAIHEPHMQDAAEDTDQDQPHMPCSQYMKLLKESIDHIHDQVLARFTHKPLIVPWSERLLRDVLHFFVINVCTLDSLPHERKLRLTADLAQFEIALDPFASRAEKSIKELGDAYRALRALRPLFFLDTSDVASSPIIGKQIPRSYVLHYLFSQTEGAIPSPRECEGNEHYEYALWLLEADEESRVGACNLALTKYRHRLQAHGTASEEHHPLYPVMLSMTSTPSPAA